MVQVKRRLATGLRGGGFDHVPFHEVKLRAAPRGIKLKGRAQRHREKPTVQPPYLVFLTSIHMLS